MFIDANLLTGPLEVERPTDRVNETEAAVQQTRFLLTNSDPAIHQENSAQRPVIDRPLAQESRSLEVLVLPKEQIDSLFAE